MLDGCTYIQNDESISRPFPTWSAVSARRLSVPTSSSKSAFTAVVLLLSKPICTVSAMLREGAASGVRVVKGALIKFHILKRDSQRVQVSLWYILRPPKYPISIYHNDTWTLWDYAQGSSVCAAPSRALRLDTFAAPCRGQPGFGRHYV